MKKAIVFDTLNHTTNSTVQSSANNYHEILYTLSSILKNDFDFIFYLCDKYPMLPILDNPKIAYALTTSSEESLAILTSINRYYDVVLVIHSDDEAYKGRYTVTITDIQSLITSKRFLCLSNTNKRYELLMLA